MADDGMLINFDLGAGAFQSRPAFKGGNWKARLTAKKSSFFNRSKAPINQVKEIGSNGTQILTGGGSTVESRPFKKQRLGNEEDYAQWTTDGARSSFHKQAARAHDLPKQIVSSLFSFNPEAKTTLEDGNEGGEDSVPAVPSNAPLQSELNTFTSLGLSASIAEHLLRKLNIKAPTAIQREAITQLVKEDTDAFIQAETGSGKTLAYLLPIVQRIASLTSPESQRVGRGSGLFAIILAPTRELSKQISVVLESLLRCAHGIVSGTVIGGEKKKSEKARLRKGLNILIATPGRLADHLDHTQVLDVSNVRWLVLDEGDRLVELGFEKDIQKIVSTLNMRKSRNSSIPLLPAERTTVLCSATMKMNVQKLGEISLRDAVHIKAAAEGQTQSGQETADGRFSAPAQLKQSYAMVPAKLRLVSLVAVLKRAFSRKGSVMKSIVFMSCADTVDFHFEVFARDMVDPGKAEEQPDLKAPEDNNEPASTFRTSALGTTLSSKDCSVHVFRLHGSLPQAIRTSTLAAYTRCKDPAVLVCTDVAARGLDLPSVDFVIEYDPPFNKDDHLHRIGRTARAGKEGRAMIFLMPGSEEGYVNLLRSERHDGAHDVTRHDSTDLLKKGFGSTGISGGGDWEQRATTWQLDVERWVLESPRHLEQARRGYQSHIRAYATHVAAERHLFDMKSLHLGHLAKAFALRDKPGSIRVPGLRPANVGKGERRQKPAAVKSTGANDVTVDEVDVQEAARKMRAKMKMQLGGSSEFNIG